MDWITHQVYHTQGELMLFPKICISYRYTFMYVYVHLYRKCGCITGRVNVGHIQRVFLMKIVSIIDKCLYFAYTCTHIIHTCIYTCVHSCVYGVAM